MIPVSITLMAARERAQVSRNVRDVTEAADITDSHRAEFVEKFCNSRSNWRWLRITDTTSYQSLGGTPMILINALLVRTEQWHPSI